MKLNIPKDQLLNPIPPRVFLCTTGTKRIGELPAINRQLNGKWNAYSEFSFEMQRTYVDMLTGETKVHPLYDKVEAPRNILVEGLSYFSLQDIDDTSGDNDVKSVSTFSLEYATSNKYLTNFHINTGEIDSKEVLFNEEQYGTDYNTDKDSFYKLASGDFDPYESYYQQVDTDADSYAYEQVQIDDAAKYAELIKANTIADSQPHERLYMKKFPNVQFFNNNESKRGLSLLHLVFENTPEWKIGNVDQSLWRKERKFSEDRISVYDFVQNNICETFGCVAVWDSIAGTVSFYEEIEDDSDVESEVNTQFETDVFISKDNLASECKVSYSSDNIKTKLVVTGSDNLDIREVNLGRNEIMDLSFYHTEEWMEQDLFEAYDDYLDELQEAQTGLDVNGNQSSKYPMSYPDAMKGWVSANNRWSDLMNEVPAEGNVVLIGDEFKKLYCTYRSISNAYYQGTINSGTELIRPSDLYVDESYHTKIQTPTNSEMYVVQGYHLVYNKNQKMFAVEDEWKSNEIALIKQLNLYHVDEDTEANKQDNILLKLKNSSSDVATIRIYDKRKEASEYDERFRYYTKDSEGKFSDVPITFTDATDFNTKKTEFAEKGTEIWTNDYYIQSIVVKASSGVSEAPDSYSMQRWIKDELTAEAMDLEGYKVTYIGTMGAYFVLAKDETIPDNLQDYGVRLLEEKHKTYTTIFQTQTEAMFSQEKAQCIVQDEQPEGDYKEGTRWLDTNSNPIVLKEYKDSGWVAISASVSEDDKKNYENYQRYIDNYNKLIAVQKALSEKEREAEYCLNGYGVPERVLDLSDGSSLEENMHRAALTHFNSASVHILGEYDTLEELQSTHPSGVSNDAYVVGDNLYVWKVDESQWIKGDYTVAGESMNINYPLYTFTTSFDPITYGENTAEFNTRTQYYTYGPVTDGSDAYVYTPVTIRNEDEFNTYETLYVQTGGHIFVVYLQGKTPYVAYANSQGVYQMIMEYIRDRTEMNKFFTVDQWIRLSPFIKEDEFNDSNFLLTGYESEEERIKICQELMEAADKELKTLCKPSLEFSMTMANILALPEFAPLFNQFQLGNFIRVGIRDGYVKRSRLLEVSMGFDNLSDFSCTFGNLVTTKSEIDKHAELLSQAVSAGKQVAKSSGAWQKSVDKTNKLEQEISNGLQDMALAIGGASGQAISWDSTGMHFRKYKNGSTTEYEPEEMAIINNALVATNDSWRTSKAAFGKYMIDGVERWGPIAEYVTADTIEGKYIKGGSIQIGDEQEEGGGLFTVDEKGNVKIMSNGVEKYAGTAAVEEIKKAYQYTVELSYSGSTVFASVGANTIVTAIIRDYGVDVTHILPVGTKFTWLRGGEVYRTTTLTDTNKPTDGVVNADVNNLTANQINIKHTDIEGNSFFSCQVDFDETLIQKGE